MMRSNTERSPTESSIVFRMNTPYQIEMLKEFGKGYLTLLDTCSYIMDIEDCFSEESFFSTVRKWCESVAVAYPKATFTCNAVITNRKTGCSMYVDAELKGKYLYIIERDGIVCISEKSPVCVDCGCSLKRVINGRRFECPNCGIPYVSSAYVAEEDSCESGCHVFCHPKSYKIRIS